MENILVSGKENIMNTYGRFPLVFEKGNGMYITDENGKNYLDFVAGIAVNCLGHANEKIADAISTQARTLIHCSNLYWTKPQLALSEKLVKNSCFKEVFFCNSGAEAIESSLKLAKKYGSKNGKFEMISMKNSFHGRTIGAVSVTGQEKYQKDFRPLLQGISHVEINNFTELEKAVTDKTAAIIIEPIQGEGGIIQAEKEYLQKVRELCDEKDILLIFDEVQCGLGRLGTFFAYQYFGVEPDVVTIAKGLGGGVPIGAMLAKEKACVFVPGDHASTFGGNPLATAAGNVVCDELLNSLIDNAEKQGKYLTEKLVCLQKKHDVIIDIRGVGLLQGIELSIPCKSIIDSCIEKGLLLVSAGANIIRFVPALIVTEEDINKAMNILDSALQSNK